jgi:response regulator RpfG family c-di-GMP phosphodiesterase
LAVLEGNQSPSTAPDDPSKPVVICVDDDENNLNALARVLRARCTVLLASDGQEALGLVEAHPDVSAILADLHMPGLPGSELLARVSQLRPHCRRAVVTGFPESEELIAAINAGHLHYVITKPWKLTDLLQVVDQLVHTFKLERDNNRLLDELRGLNQQLREHELHLESQLTERGVQMAAQIRSRACTRTARSRNACEKRSRARFAIANRCRS